MGWSERKQIIAELEQKRGSRVICYVTSDRENANAAIGKDVLPILFEHLSSIGKPGATIPHVDLLVHTAGGDTLAGFGICRLFRECVKKMGVLVPFRCHSSGTLLALGADEILMTKAATLSPIDPSLVGPLNPAVEIGPGQRQLVQISVESVAGFKDLVMKDWEIEGEESLTAAFKLLGEKVHPLALGDVYRARQQIEDLATKLLKAHRKQDSKGVDRIVKTLTRGLGSHDYLISRSDARSLLGKQIAPDNHEVEGLLWSIFDDFSKEMHLRERFDPQAVMSAHRGSGGTGSTKETLILSVIENTAFSDVAERDVEVFEIPTPAGPQAVGRVARAGWRRQS